MSEQLSPALRALREQTRRAAVAVGARLAKALAARLGVTPDLQACGAGGDVAAALGFACAQGQALAPEAEQGGATLCDAGHPLAGIAALCGPSGAAAVPGAELVLLAVLAELHEGYASLFRLLHPQGLPLPTVALALNWLEHEQALARAAAEAGCQPAPDAPPAASRSAQDAYALREAVEALLDTAPLGVLGLLQAEGSGPWHSRNLVAGAGVWDALWLRAPRLPATRAVAGYRSVPGLENWLAEPAVRFAVAALARGERCMLSLLGGTAAMRATRVRALLGAAGLQAIQARLHAADSPAARAAVAREAYCAATLHGGCPWLDFDAGELEAPLELLPPEFARVAAAWEAPLLFSAGGEQVLPDFDLPMLTLRIEALAPAARRQMWSELLPQLQTHAGMLAARYPVEPDEARSVAMDLALRARCEARALTLDDIAGALRDRTAWRGRPGVRRIQPRADWSRLLIPARGAGQLRQAVARVHQQLTVLDDWGFEQGRQDRRGLRLLFYGPPGTGKTLAAEAMARALGIDVLAVDIASLVSKWIGETEKNLAAVFEVAESSRALLFFDEADALFGRRTEVGDARDRYANLETAYLLQRLERFEGVAVLATNLRTSMDAAFARRFEYIVEFPEPDAALRVSLWRLHLPPGAPLAPDVDLHELAEWYAISGAQIRNAALGAAFLAAAEGGAAQIGQRHFLRAIEREYDKAGKAHPGHPPARMAELGGHRSEEKVAAGPRPGG